MEKKNLNLEDVLEVAKDIVEETTRKEQKNMEAFKRIVAGVSRKYQSIYVSQEDLEQELWIVVLEKIRDFGGADKVDPDLIARCCFNKAVDFYRYNRRRYDSFARYVEESDDSDSVVEEKGADRLHYSRFKNAEQNALLHEVIDLFPAGSRERKYVVTKLYMYGEISEEDGLEDELELPESDKESDILKLLGYKSHYPASWGNKKYQMRAKVYRYLGILPEDTDASTAKVELIRNRIEAIFRNSKYGYINVNDLLRDKPLILLSVTEELIWEAVGSSKSLLRGLSKRGEKFIMKNEEKYLLNSKKNGDVILARDC